MSEDAPVGWAVLGTANIARAAFLPALLRAGGGRVVVVGSRDLARGRAFAEREAPLATVGSYARALADPRVQAVYLPLPNHLHPAWAIRALEAGKAVLCEKPLGLSVGKVESILTAAERTGGLIWEAFVFPFHPQARRLQTLLAEGAIGEPREVLGGFHFRVRAPENIRWSAGCGGGALNDVGCYPIHLARLVFGTEPVAARALERREGHEVDAETQGMLRFPAGRRLLFTCGLERAYDAETRILGTEGAIRLSNPYHPDAADVLELHRGTTVTRERLAGGEPSFTFAIRHIHRVLAGREGPLHLARDDALGTARALELVRRHTESDHTVRGVRPRPAG
ncbi:MAG TPA: Gfo/Idh/MocA family oxidoreductase [Verrucomicrobiae bacterium]|nr:Gfo/Idh/MocA family oxidoreductase [Verrucomicrobiae bacterium]